MRRPGFLGLLLVATLASAQDGARVVVSNLDLETYRLAVSAERRAIMEANIVVGLDRRARFFALYDEYEKDRAPADTERFSVMQRYAAARSGVSEPQAMALVSAVASLQLKEIQLRAKHAEKIGKELGGHVGARFYQVDDVVTTTLRLRALQSVQITPPAAPR
jgi:hypothetical protein